MSFGSVSGAIALYESEESRAVLYMIRHDPLAIIGLLLIGASGILRFRMYSKLESLGVKVPRTISLPLTYHFWLSQTYLLHARAGSWSPWPAYLMWLCLAAGILLLVLGLAYL